MAEKMLKKTNKPVFYKNHNIFLWQRPRIFFLIMGISIIIIILLGYAVGTKLIDEPILVAGIIVGLGLGLLVINIGLTRSFEKIAEANEMKSEFIRIVSHQLRAPISNCRWATEFLISGRIGKAEEKQQKYFNILRENIKRMQELISKLLTVSRIESGKLPLKIESFPLQNLIQDLILKFRPLAEASNVKVIFTHEPDVPQAVGDSSQTKVVLENLLDNAIRYASLSLKDHEGKVRIRLKTKNNSLYFEIKDNGIGISESDQKYIFQKFFRGKKVLKYRTQGSGLGLYISKSIIDESGGKIGFSSVPQKGSTFWFTLPSSIK